MLKHLESIGFQKRYKSNLMEKYFQKLFLESFDIYRILQYYLPSYKISSKSIIDLNVKAGNLILFLQEGIGKNFF